MAPLAESSIDAEERKYCGLDVLRSLAERMQSLSVKVARVVEERKRKAQTEYSAEKTQTAEKAKENENQDTTSSIPNRVERAPIGLVGHRPQSAPRPQVRRTPRRRLRTHSARVVEDIRDQISDMSSRAERRSRDLEDIRREQQQVEESLRRLQTPSELSRSRSRRPQTTDGQRTRNSAQAAALLQGIRATSIATSRVALNNRHRLRDESNEEGPSQRRERVPSERYLQSLVDRHITPHLPNLSTTRSGGRPQGGPNFLSVGDWNAQLSWASSLDNDPSRSDMRNFLAQVMRSNASSGHSGLSKAELDSIGSFRATSNQFADPCCICIEPIDEGQNAVLLHCAHAFHKRCILKWLAVSTKCPLCKMHAVEEQK